MPTLAAALTSGSPGSSPKTYLSSLQVRARYGGVSDMSLWRWSRDPELGFPAPIRINNRRFWDCAALDAFDQRRTLQRDQS